MEDNNIRFNNKNNNKGNIKFISNYENQRQYTKEFLESLYAQIRIKSFKKLVKKSLFY